MRLLALAAALGLALAGGARAQSVPTQLHFQGRLTDAANNPLSGANAFVFEIYDASAGGTLLWTETQPAVTVTNGVFAAQLGSVTPLASSVFAGATAYLQVTVNGNTLAPRERLLTAAYAHNAQMLGGRDYTAFVSTDAATQSIAGAKTFTGTVVVPTPTLAGHAATKAYVDSVGGSSLLTATSTWSGQNTFLHMVSISSTLALSGSVGIGTANPAEKLHVSSGSVLAEYGVKASTAVLTPLASVPTGTAGMLYYDNASSKLRLFNGAWVDVATGTTGGAAAHAAEHSAGGTDPLTGTLSISSITASPNASAANRGGLVISTNVVQTAGDLITYGAFGVNTSSPTHALTLPAGSSGLALYNTADQTTNVERVVASWRNNTFVLGEEASGTGSPSRNIQLKPAAANGAVILGNYDATIQNTLIQMFGKGDLSTGFTRLANSQGNSVVDLVGQPGGITALDWYYAPVRNDIIANNFAGLEFGTGINTTSLVLGRTYQRFRTTTGAESVDFGVSIGVNTSTPVAAVHVASGSILSEYGVVASTAVLTPLASQPTGSAGMLYYDNASSKLRLFNGAWVDVATGTTGGSSSAVQRSGDTMTGQLTLAGSTLTVQGGEFSVAGATFAVKGGNVGIGDAAPSDHLKVSFSAFTSAGGLTLENMQTAGHGASVNFHHLGTGDWSSAIRVSNTNNAPVDGLMTFLQPVAGADAQTVMTLRGSSLGLGTALPATKLEVNGSASFGSGATKSTFTTAGALSFPAAYVPSGASDAATKGYVDGLTGAWTTSGSQVLLGNSANNVVVQSTLTVQGAAFSVAAATLSVSGGMVGVGTANPATTLEVRDGYAGANGLTVTSTNNGAANANIFLKDTSGFDTRNWLLNTNRNATGGFSISESNAHGGDPYAAGTTRLEIAKDGSVGIDYATPASPLVVNSISGAGNIQQWMYATSSSYLLNLGQLVTGGVVRWDFSQVNNGTPYNDVLVLDRGSVGIATAAPSAVLDVNGNASFGAGATKSTFSAAGALSFPAAYVPASASDAATKGYVDGLTGAWTTSGSQVLLGNAANNVVVQSTLTVQGDAFSVGGSTLVAKNGRLGVGIATPGASVHVYGAGSQNVRIESGDSYASQLSLLAVTSNNRTESQIQFKDRLGFVAPISGGFIATMRENQMVGVGATDPVARLHVSSANAVAADTILEVSSGTGTGQELLVVKGDGKVGIGTDSPIAKLEVAPGTSNVGFIVSGTHLKLGTEADGWSTRFGDGVVKTYHQTLTLNAGQDNGASANMLFYTSENGVANAERMRITNTGSVGIGTTTPTALLDVNGTAEFGSGATKSTFSAAGALSFPAAYVPSNAYDAATKGYVDGLSSPWSTSGSQVLLANAGDNAVVQSTLTVQGNAFSVGASTFVVRGSSVGIRTSTLDAMLTMAAPGRGGVALHIPAENGNTGFKLARPSDNNTSFEWYGSGNSLMGQIVDTSVMTVNGQWQFNPLAVNQVPLSVLGASGQSANLFTVTASGSSSPNLMVDALGKVGVAVSAPQTTLDVAGDAQFGSGAAKSTFTATGNLQLVSGATVTANGSLTLSTAASAATASPNLFLSPNGNVGVGTSSTLANLDVFGSGPTFRLRTAAAGSLFMQALNSNEVDIMTTNASDLVMGTNFLKRWKLDTNGNVGIGTMTPTALLDVNGAAEFGTGTTKSTFSATGALSFPAGYAPSNSYDAATKGYVDSQVTSGSGWTTSGSQVLLGNSGNNVVVQSTLTVQGQNFSVSGSTFTILGGNVGIGYSAPVYPLSVSYSVPYDQGRSINVFTAAPTATAGTVYGLINNISDQHASGTMNTTEALFSAASFNAAANTTNLLGGFFRTQLTGASPTGTVSTAAGLYVDSVSNQATGTPAATFSNQYGVRVKNQGAGSGTNGLTIGTAYGVYVDAQSGAGANYGVYSAGGTNYFAGNTGVGTTTPGQALTVASGVNRTPVSWLSNDSAGATGYLYVDTSAMGIKSDAGSMQAGSDLIAVDKGHFAQIFTNGAERVRVDAQGQTGVGTSAPSARLHVSSANASSNDVLLEVSSGTATGQELLVVKGDGKIGVLTSSPGTALTLGRGTITVKNASTDSDGLKIYQAAGDASTIMNHYSGPVVIGTADTERLRIDASGNVGIGAPAPAMKLDVEGGAQFGSGATKSTFSATGVLTFPTGYVPANPLEAATKGYVDGAAGGGWTRSGTQVLLANGGDNVTIASSVTVQGRMAVGATHSAIAQFAVNGVHTANSGYSILAEIDGTMTAGANNDTLAALYLSPTYSVGAYTGLRKFGIYSGTAESSYFAGGLGLGITDPQARLHVHSASGLGGAPGVALTAADGSPTTISAVGPSSAGVVHGHVILSSAGFSSAFNAVSDHGGVSAAIARHSSAQFRVVTTNDGTNYDSPAVLAAEGDGKVGVGTSAPSARLHVSSGAAGSPTENIVLVTTGSTNLFRVQANGDVFALGAFTGGGADLAEMYRAAGPLEAGELAMLRGDGLVARYDGSARPLGIISTDPGSLLGWTAKDGKGMPGHRKVALAGRVPAKVRGAVAVGDDLAADERPGWMRRAKPGELTVGIALSASDAAEGSVIAFVRLGDRGLQSTIAAQRERIETLEARLGELERLVKEGTKR